MFYLHVRDLLEISKIESGIVRSLRIVAMVNQAEFGLNVGVLRSLYEDATAGKVGVRFFCFLFCDGIVSITGVVARPDAHSWHSDLRWDVWRFRFIYYTASGKKTHGNITCTAHHTRIYFKWKAAVTSITSTNALVLRVVSSLLKAANAIYAHPFRVISLL